MKEEILAPLVVAGAALLCAACAIYWGRRNNYVPITTVNAHVLFSADLVVHEGVARVRAESFDSVGMP